MKISIITVCYNSEATITETLKSVQAQTYPDVEHIIVDGKSKDSTLQIVSAYPHIAKMISEKDAGIYDAMNKGVALATGEVIGILNSDDLYADNTVLEDVMRCFNEDKNLQILYGNLVYVKKDDIGKVVRKWKSGNYHGKFFEYGNVPPHPALFVRSSVYKEAGNFNQQYRLSADYEFMLRIFKRYSYKVKYINRLMVRMRMGGATNKSLQNIINGNKEIIKAWKDNGLQMPFICMPVKFLKRILQFI